MSQEAIALPGFEPGEVVRVWVAGMWVAGKIAMFDPQNPTLCVGFAQDVLPPPLRRCCYVRRDRPEFLRRGPVLVGEFLDQLDAASWSRRFGPRLPMTAAVSESLVEDIAGAIVLEAVFQRRSQEAAMKAIAHLCRLAVAAGVGIGWGSGPS